MLYDCSSEPTKLNKLKTGCTASPTRKFETARPPKKVNGRRTRRRNSQYGGQHHRISKDGYEHQWSVKKTDNDNDGFLFFKPSLIFSMYSLQKRCSLPSSFLVRKSARDFYVSLAVFSRAIFQVA